MIGKASFIILPLISILNQPICNHLSFLAISIVLFIRKQREKHIVRATDSSINRKALCFDNGSIIHEPHLILILVALMISLQFGTVARVRMWLQYINCRKLNVVIIAREIQVTRIK